jgi:L-threonylcarbamoyladenylate synthase
MQLSRRSLDKSESFYYLFSFCAIGGELLLAAARIINYSVPESIKEGAKIILDGGIVAFPTETVYGLGADARNPLAVARIFEIKARPRFDPVIVHVSDPKMAGLYGEIPDLGYKLAKKFWPGPLTLVVPKTSLTPSIVTAGLETVAIRVPSHPAALALIRAADCGIAAPSANPFGYVSPTEVQHVAELLSDKVDLMIDGGPSEVGVESTIVSLIGEVPCILRAGGTTIEALKSFLGKMQVQTGAIVRPQAPGQLSRHYATRTRLDILEENNELLDIHERTGLLSLTPPSNPRRYAAVELLSGAGDLREAAANLFRALRKLDGMSLDRIIARPIPEQGLGSAIMDRLRRCSARNDTNF